MARFGELRPGVARTRCGTGKMRTMTALESAEARFLRNARANAKASVAPGWAACPRAKPGRRFARDRRNMIFADQRARNRFYYEKRFRDRESRRPSASPRRISTAGAFCRRSPRTVFVGREKVKLHAVARLADGEVGDRCGNGRRRRDGFAGRAATDASSSERDENESGREIDGNQAQEQRRAFRLRVGGGPATCGFPFLRFGSTGCSGSSPDS